MPPLVFAMQFGGHATPVEGAPGTLRARTFAYGQTLRTTFTPDAIETTIQSAPGASSTFESEVVITGEGRFAEVGSISYGTAGSIRFQTVGHGLLGPSGVRGLERGAVIWEVIGGEGQFAAATGLITSPPSAPKAKSSTISMPCSSCRRRNRKRAACVRGWRAAGPPTGSRKGIPRWPPLLSGTPAGPLPPRRPRRVRLDTIGASR